ncbi:MAG: DUF2339 domain-containing protein [Propionibacteriaceae bacterium]|nr:DUF2339 domain-containing protein [Propionibacteriaceae bacterium]
MDIFSPAIFLFIFAILILNIVILTYLTGLRKQVNYLQALQGFQNRTYPGHPGVPVQPMAVQQGFEDAKGTPMVTPASTAAVAAPMVPSSMAPPPTVSLPKVPLPPVPAPAVNMSQETSTSAAHAGQPTAVQQGSPDVSGAPMVAPVPSTEMAANMVPSKLAAPMATVGGATGVPGVQPSNPQAQQQLLAPGQGSSTRFNENFLGRNLLPLIAAVLGLIGLVSLGVVVVPYLPDVVKIAAMFVLSFAVGGVGYWLHRRNSSVLTQALLGTGLGGVFIAILVTHVYFNAINEIFAFSFLGVWIIASMWLSKHTNSLLVAILAHVGMVASIGYGYLVGLADDKLLLLVIYQILATVAIILGNMYWVRQLQRFGLFASLAMIIVSLAIMGHRLIGYETGFASQLHMGLIVAAFAVQFVGATVIAYLLFISCARVKEPTARGILAFINSGMWVTVLILSVATLTYKISSGLSESTFGYTFIASWLTEFSDEHFGFGIAVGVSVALGFLPALAIAISGRRVKVSRALEGGTLGPVVIISAVMLVSQLGISVHSVSATAENSLLEPLGILLLFPCYAGILLTIGYLALGQLSGSGVQQWIGRGLLIFQSFVMVFHPAGYSTMVKHWGIIPALVYLAILLCLSYWTWRQVKSEKREKYQKLMVVFSFVGAEFSLVAICFAASTSTTATLYDSIFVVLSAVVLLMIHLFGAAQPQLFYRLWELGLIIFASGVQYTAGLEIYENRSSEAPDPLMHLNNTFAIIAGTIALAILIVLMIDWIRITAKATSFALRTPNILWPRTGRDIICGVGLTIAGVGLFAPYDWFAIREESPWGFPTSLACMIVALLVVGLGLWSRGKPLRLYGLIVTIACVLKLVTLDIGSFDSIARVVAFLGGAAVCFGISALYNYAAKHFDKDLSQPIAPSNNTAVAAPSTIQTQPEARRSDNSQHN